MNASTSFAGASRRLEGRLVVLEPLSAAHEDGLWEASRDERTWRWLPIRRPETRAELRAWLDEALASADVPFATVAQADGRVLGSTRFLALAPEHRRLEIGWTWLHPDAWGTGANTEAKLLQLEHAFGPLGALRVELKTDARNERSRAALEAIGAVFEGVHRRHMLVQGGRRRDSAWYAVTIDEWPAVRAGLRERVSVRAAGARGRHG